MAGRLEQVCAAIAAQKRSAPATPSVDAVSTEISSPRRKQMTYAKPQILDSCRAAECIKGLNKFIEMADNGTQGTPAAYEADE
jgi:hypothetical protein